MKRFILSYWKLIVLFIVGFLTSFLIYQKYCDFSSSIASFDLQTILTWNYSSQVDLVPVRDLFFPYGLLGYYKNIISEFFVLNLLIFPIFIVFCFMLFENLFKNKTYIFISIVFLYIFIVMITGLNVFNRYGVFVFFTLFLSYSFYKNILSNKFLFIIGSLISIIFFFLIDQGIYFLLSFLFVFLFNKLIKFKKTDFFKTGTYILVFKNLFSVLTGILIGVVPFIFFLGKQFQFSDFILLMQQISSLSLLAKTPFYTFIFSLDNLFTLLILFFSIFYLSYIFVFKKNLISIFNYIETGLVFNIILLEQKSIIRSISETITFVSFLLLIFLVYDLFFVRIKIKKKIFSVFILAFVLIISFLGNFNHIQSIDFKYYNLNVNTCYKRSLSAFLSENSLYSKVSNKVKGYVDFNGKVISYPGDPIFYVLFNQKPPYYTSIYEASSLEAQNSLIDFTEKENVKYAILNMDNYAIQDGVPNYMRSPHLLKYILNNFSEKEKIGNFLILEKRSNLDFFKEGKTILTKNYKNFLLNINLGFVPYSEGLYKNKYALDKNNNFLVRDLDKENTNRFLSNNYVDSDKKVLLLKKKENKNSRENIKIYTDGNLFTSVSFNSCLKYCLFNISNLPLFYNNRKIDEIEVDNNYSVTLIKMSDKNFEYIW